MAMTGRVKNYVGGPIFVLLGTDGTDLYGVAVDSDGHLQIDVVSIADIADIATETTLATLATEAKLELVRLLLVSIDGKDFATQTTLATLATEAKLELVRLLLASIDGKDFATQTTLAAILTELQLKADLTETQPISAASLPLPSGAATQTTLAAILTELQLKADLTETQPISAASLPLPSGAATQTTLASILAQLDVALSTRALEAGGNLADIKTAVEKIDDLRGALDSVDTDEIVVNVDESALPSGAATETTLADVKTAVEKIDDLQNALNSVATDRLVVESKDGDKIFGFESIVERRVADLSLTAGTNYLDGSAVPSGKVWMITKVNILAGDATPTRLRVYVTGLATALHLMDNQTPTDDQWYFWDGEIYMQEGDYLTIRIDGADLNGDLYLDYAGVQMDAP